MFTRSTSEPTSPRKRDIARALPSELPQIRVVSRARDAHTVLEFRGIAERTLPPGTMTVSHDQPINYRSDGQATYETRSETVEVGQAVQVAGHAEGIVVRGGEVKAVLHEGLWTPAFPTQFAARFIRAWREANP